ncbi:MAG: UDP-N-acetylglucosamine 2-epimerase [Betaproteobacteria bacterium]|uniref:UDP-N-acetylglucosamine 2-epimerase n=1 Tax=Candidatus Proximibacter danicus TaxID=2954365 RepID=A0A9D7K257_9PROT|nr:UDP-N-acetylglucosamine 2-epimerase [Candidatus Proximibacter danicus]
MADTLTRLSPDVCVLYGDRGEVLAAAIAATSLGIPIAHLQGGDLSGSVDEQVRHAGDKACPVALSVTESSGQRIRSMGEESWRARCGR